jgi:tight adherence protein B
MNGRRLIAALGSFAAILVATPAAGAAPAVQLTEASGAKFPAKAFVLTLPERRDLQPGDITVHENGKDVKSLQVVPADAAGARTFAAMLVIDTSQSMRGAPIHAAMAAARQFAARRPAQQRLGVVFFNRNPTLALAPTTDSAKISRVLASPPALAKGTRIYDATALATRVLADTKATARAVLVLSDGADAGSSVAPAAVADAARKTKTRVFSVGLRSRSYDGLTLRELARSTDGRYAEADERQLANLFAGLGRRFGREYLVRYQSLAPLATQVDVRAGVAGVAGTAVAAYISPPFQPVEHGNGASRPAGFSGSDAGLWLAGALAALLLGTAAFVVVRSSRRTVRTRIADFTGGASSSDGTGLALDALETEAADATRRRRTPSRRWTAFAEDVDVAGLPATAERIAAWTIAGTLLVAVLALVTGNAVLVLLVLPAPIIVHVVVSARANAARRDFEAQLADNLQVVASAMRAGQSFVGALAVAVEDALQPAKRELHRAVTDERLGVPLDEALGRTAHRMRSEELEYVGLVATLQRETGGSTAEVIDRITQTIRERAELKRLVRGLTAQGRLGGGIVSAIPLGLAALFLVTRPGYFDPLLQSTFGVVSIAAAVAMVTTGWIVIRKIVDIKV